MSVKVQVNVINQLRLLRQSTFKDPLAFLDEDVQNAQRAKATQVNIDTNWSSSMVTIFNNGDILDDPQKLFSLAETGWDEEVTKNENPFGIGFFSNISVSDYIVIYSGTKKIIFDVKTMLETGNTEIQVEDIGPDATAVQGFKMELHNFDFNEVSLSKIKERAGLLGKFVQDLEIVHNGNLIERKDLTQIDTDSPFAMAVEEASFVGWIALSRNFSSGIKLFYKGRFVITLDIYYCVGELHLKDSAVNLVAPDRKDIIRDSKYDAFYSVIREYIELIATDAALTGGQKNQEQYADSINWYADIAKAKDAMKFTIVRCDDQGVRYLQNIIQGGKSDDDGEDLGAPARTVNGQAVQGESHFNEVVVEKEISNAPREVSSGGSSFSAGSEIVSSSEEVEEDGSQLFAVERPKFWVLASELNKYESKVRICKHYDICLVLAQNKFQEKVLGSLEKDGQVFHIRTLDERIKVKASLTNTQPYKREERAIMLFDMLSRMVGHSYNVFAIGDLMVTRTLELPEIQVFEERIEDSVLAIHCEEVNKVYIDRSLLRGVQLLEHTNPRLALTDYKFILSNLPTLVKELAFTTQASATKISNTILKTLGGE